MSDSPLVLSDIKEATNTLIAQYLPGVENEMLFVSFLDAPYYTGYLYSPDGGYKEATAQILCKAVKVYGVDGEKRMVKLMTKTPDGESSSKHICE